MQQWVCTLQSTRGGYGHICMYPLLCKNLTDSIEKKPSGTTRRLHFQGIINRILKDCLILQYPYIPSTDGQLTQGSQGEQPGQDQLFRPVAHLLIDFIQGNSLHNLLSPLTGKTDSYMKNWLHVVSLFMKRVGKSPKQMENYCFISFLHYYIKTQPSTHTQSVKLCGCIGVFLCFECTCTTENRT